MLHQKRGSAQSRPGVSQGLPKRIRRCVWTQCSVLSRVARLASLAASQIRPHAHKLIHSYACLRSLAWRAQVRSCARTPLPLTPSTRLTRLGAYSRPVVVRTVTRIRFITSHAITRYMDDLTFTSPPPATTPSSAATKVPGSRLHLSPCINFLPFSRLVQDRRRGHLLFRRRLRTLPEGRPNRLAGRRLKRLPHSRLRYLPGQQPRIRPTA